MRNETFQVYEVIGLTKGGDGCGSRNRPGLYTSIITYLPWIKKRRDQYGRMLLKQHYQRHEAWVPVNKIKTSFSGPNMTTDHLWSDGEVPYRIESSFTAINRKGIEEAMGDISAAVPCIRFR